METDVLFFCFVLFFFSSSTSLNCCHRLTVLTCVTRGGGGGGVIIEPLLSLAGARVTLSLPAVRNYARASLETLALLLRWNPKCRRRPSQRPRGDVRTPLWVKTQCEEIPKAERTARGPFKSTLPRCCAKRESERERERERERESADKQQHRSQKPLLPDSVPCCGLGEEEVSSHVSDIYRYMFVWFTGFTQEAGGECLFIYLFV